MKPAEKTTVYDCCVLNLPNKQHRKGNLTTLNATINIPFQIERVYYLYDIPAGEIRGGHAHKNLKQLVIAASGSFDVLIDDSVSKKTVSLNRPYIGLYIVPGIWRELCNFSSGSVCLVVASEKYKENDYIRDYNKFLQIKRKQV